MDCLINIFLRLWGAGTLPSGTLVHKTPTKLHFVQFCICLLSWHLPLAAGAHVQELDLSAIAIQWAQGYTYVVHRDSERSASWGLSKFGQIPGAVWGLETSPPEKTKVWSKFGLCCYDKTLPPNLGSKWFICLILPDYSPSLREAKTGTRRLKQRWWDFWPALFGSCPAIFLIPSRTACPGVATPTVGWALLHHPTV